jgi:hypothetical protein
MRMRMRFVAAETTRMVMRCSTCHQTIGLSDDKEETADVNLFGAVKYLVCPTCKQTVAKELQTPAYKSAWTRARRSGH